MARGAEFAIEHLADIIEQMKDNSWKLSDVVDTLDEEILKLDEGDIKDKVAVLLASDEIHEKALDIVQIAAVNAAIQSVEFSFPPFIDHLLNAIRLQENNIITVGNWWAGGSMGYPHIEINFESLGTVDQWAIIVEESSSHKTRGIPITENAIFRYPYESDEYTDLAMRMWVEKYYKVDREGKRVIRVKKKQKRGAKGRFVKSDEAGEEVDITDRFAGKYTETIMRRLSQLPPDKAPFWWIIENGNASVPGFSGDGEPYPLVKPTRIQDEVNSAVDIIYDELTTHYRYESEELLVSALYRAIGIKKKGRSLANVPVDVRDYVEYVLESVGKGNDPDFVPLLHNKITATGRRYIETVDGLIVEISEKGTGAVKQRDVRGVLSKIGSF